MNAPKRWLDEGGGATAGERDLLRRGLAMDPPAEAQATVWAAILAGLPEAGAVGTGGAGSVAGKAASGAKAAVATKAVGAGLSGGAVAAAAGAGILKSALIGAGCGVLVLATYSAVSPSAPDPRPAPPVAVASPPEPAPASPRTQGARVAAPDPTAAASADPAPDHRPNEPRAPLPGASSPPADSAAPPDGEMEAHLVSEVYDTLHRGDAPGALLLLDRIRARFPAGGLGQEREALSIEALYRSGRRSEASARAAAFLQANPSSTLAARVQSFAN
jgi:hypothetical protein